MPYRKTTKNNKVRLRAELKQLLVIGVVVLLVYVIAPQLGAFGQSLTVLGHMQPAWAAAAALLYLLTAPASGLLYKCLALRQLPYFRTVAVQYGSSFANRLLPAGLGALGVGYFYLRKQQFTEAAALSIVTLNNVLGFVGHVVLVAALVLVVPDRLSAGVSHLQLDWTAVIAVLVGFAVLAAAYLVLSRRVQRLADVVYRTLRQLLVYKKHKRRLLLAFGTSLLLTLLYSSSLWASGQALGAQFDVAQAVIILAVGVGVGAALPLPGGLGGAEAGLVAGLLAFGQSAETAIATAILYRLVTYWLGFAVGAAAFVICRQRRYF